MTKESDRFPIFEKESDSMFKELFFRRICLRRFEWISVVAADILSDFFTLFRVSKVSATRRCNKTGYSRGGGAAADDCKNVLQILRLMGFTTTGDT